MADPDTHDVLTTDQRFAIVPEWVIDAQVSDAAFRLYAVLLRYGQTSGQRMPSRQALARRLHKSCTDTIDRAMRELVHLGAVQVERRRRGRENLTNRYHLRTAGPAGGNAGGDQGGRTDAATPDQQSADGDEAQPPGRRNAASPGRTDAGRVAAEMRPDPEHFTQNNPPPTPPPTTDRTRRPTPRPEEAAPDARQLLLTACGVTDLDELAHRCATLRQQHQRPTGRWTAECLHAALHVAVRSRGWPATSAVPALLQVAADPDTRSPMRLAEAGPWWDTPVQPAIGTVHSEELAEAERRLDALDGGRLALQREARRQLAAERAPLTRATVTTRACQILDQGWLTRSTQSRASSESV